MARVNYHRTLDCPLCFKMFSTPRVLPCVHTFCEKCLGGYIESNVHGRSKFTCPLCAAETVPSNSKLAIDKWATTFPSDTLVCALMELSMTSDDNDDKCEPCKSDGEDKIAEFWCTVCQEKLCSSCNGAHKRNKMLRNHTIVCIDEMAQHKQFNINFDQECGRHGDKVKLFCVDHRELCCAVCVATDHRQCNDIHSIDDIAREQTQQSTSDYHRIIGDITNMKTEMENIMSENQSNVDQILREKNQMLHNMDKKIDRILNHLNKLRNTFREETDQLYQDTEMSILKRRKTMQSFMTNVKNSEEILKIVEINGTPQEKIVTFEKIRSQIASHYYQLKGKLKDDVKVDFFMKSGKLLDDIESSMNSGSVDATPISSVKSRDALQNTNEIIKYLNSHTEVSTDMVAAQVEKVEDLMTPSVALVKAVTKDKLGRYTWFTGGTCLRDGRLVMCDCMNSRLVELNDEYDVLKDYKIDGRPTDVATGNKDNEIYIDVNERCIYKCTLHIDLTIVSRIQAPSGTWGIAVSGDNIIASTSDAVEILTQDGSTVRSIPKAGHNSYVAVSQTQRRIYHRDNNDVVCRTFEGQEVFRYQYQQLVELRGIFADKHNNVYICGKDSRNVLQISSDGQRSRIILEKPHSIYEPYFVILHPKKKELIVTSQNEDTVCEIYKFLL